MAKNKLLKTLPSDEISVVKYHTLNGDIYRITRHRINQMFTIYKVVDDCFEKLGTDINPTVLEKKYINI